MPRIVLVSADDNVVVERPVPLPGRSLHEFGKLAGRLVPLQVAPGVLLLFVDTPPASPGGSDHDGTPEKKAA